MAVTLEDYKVWVLKQVKDLRNPDKNGMDTVINDGDQKTREYENAKADAARTGNPDDIAKAKRLKVIVEFYNSVKKSRELTDKAQALYENIDSNRKKLDSLKQLGEGTTDEAKKIQRQLTRARATLKGIEAERDAFGKAPKKNTEVVKEEVAVTEIPVKATGEKTSTPAKTPSKTPSKTPTKEAVVTDEQKTQQGITAAQDLTLPATLFKNIPSLANLLDRYVKENWTNDKLREEIRNDTWYRQNSQEIRNRYVQLYNYQDLIQSGQDATATDYAKQIDTLKRKLEAKARQVGSGLASDPEALDKAARNMYITNVGIDDPMTTDIIAGAIRPITSTLGGKVTEGYSGQALKDYQAIQAIAKANGFKVSDILPGGANEQQVLQGLAKGTIDPDRLAQDARKLAAQGQPQYVRDLLGQGYNLDQVYSPYKNTMAAILEINPDQIDLNDPTLRAGINEKGDMNIYEFKKLLRQDKRWQYTDQARQDASTAALTVLRDFGFQG